MKYVSAIFKDKFLLFGAFFILLPTMFQIFFGVQGQIFLIHPEAKDPRFHHAVLYMMKHSIDGASALVLNKPYPDNRKNKLSTFLTKRKITLYWGGPINDETDIFVLKQNGDQKPIITSFDKLKSEDIDILDKIENSPDRFRIYIGHAEWGALQYEAERINKIWILGVQKPVIWPIIFSMQILKSDDIWLKTLNNSDFYKKQAIKGKISA